ncbi:MAG TPA: hypothetical protein VMV27_14315 [Candidatus Binataceae bacterium]|nr:hypothetical protein [Candidatus Binataceae bacterium]
MEPPALVAEMLAAESTQASREIRLQAATPTQPTPVVIIANQKSTGLAALLSFFWCGLGQIYNGQFLKGMAMMFLYPPLLWFGLVSTFTGALLAGGAATEADAAAGGGAAILGMLTLGAAIILWIFGVVNAYRTADRLNHEQHASILALR